jgi:hypothetical protein
VYKCTNSWPACPNSKDNPITNAIGGKFGNKQTYKQAVKWRQVRSSSRTTWILAETKATCSLYGGLQDSGDFFGFRAIDDGGTDDGFSPDIGTYDKAHIPTTSSTSDCSTSSSGGVDYVPSMIDNRTVHTLPPAMFGLGKLSSACEEGDQVDRREAYH